MEALTLLQLINNTLNANFESVEALKTANKEKLFSEDMNDKIIDLSTNDITLLYVDFNSTQLAHLTGLPQSSISDKILKGKNGVIYNEKDINIYELSRYLRDKKIDTLSVKDFRECVQELILEYRVNKHTKINNKSIMNIQRVKTKKITTIDDFIFILEDFSMIKGEDIKPILVKQFNIPAGKKYRFIVEA